MDRFYDRNSAEQMLIEHARIRLEQEWGGLQVAQMVQGITESAYRVERLGAIYKLLHKKDERNVALAEPEEVVGAFQGIVYNLDIAPVINRLTNKNQAKYARQSVGLTALKTGVFDEVFNAIAEVHNLFRLQVGKGMEQRSTFATFEDNPALDVCNRYLTHRRNAQYDEREELSETIDPHGFLLAAAGNDYLYTSENVVQYHQLQGGKSGSPARVETCRPTVFQVGDVVEVQVSFVALPMRGNRFKISLVLRGMLQLNNEATRRSNVQRMKADASQPMVPTGGLKRRVGYAEERVDQARLRLARLNVSQEDDAVRMES
ncbi:hypothetical protein BJ165DRAFT_1535480 [Panaeolus papilionaceus]|nr:hypothetical protein BJ165DRAFT_1535480 [Panaeolus papilionaceus]